MSKKLAQMSGSKRNIKNASFTSANLKSPRKEVSISTLDSSAIVGLDKEKNSEAPMSDRGSEMSSRLGLGMLSKLNKSPTRGLNASMILEDAEF